MIMAPWYVFLACRSTNDQRVISRAAVKGRAQTSPSHGEREKRCHQVIRP